MNLDLKSYLESRLIEQERILALYLQDRGAKKFLKRDLYHKIEDKLEKFIHQSSDLRWLSLPGLRGSGKTTALAQIYFKYEKHFSKRILYLSLDEIKSKLNSSLYEVLDLYEEILGQSYQKIKEPIILLLDEVHYDPNWALALKSLYDKSRNVFIVSTGSSAISLNMNADIVRRTYTIYSYPLSFTEYIYITQKTSSSREDLLQISTAIQKAVTQSPSFKEAYELLQKQEPNIRQVLQDLDKFDFLNFLKFYSLPSVLSLSDEVEIYHSLNTVMQSIIHNDLSSIQSYSQEINSKMENLLFLLASSEALSLHTISKNLGINLNTLSSVLETLVKAQLLIKIPAFGSAAKLVRKPAKYIFAAPAIRASLVSIMGASALEQIKGKLLEDFVFSTYKRLAANTSLIQLSYDVSKSGADLIYRSPALAYVMEIGWNKKSFTQILETMKRTKIQSGILLTNTSLAYNREHNILSLPLEWFALL